MTSWALVRYQPRTTFLSLPRELRDQIYEDALVSSHLIFAWYGSYETEPIDELQESGLWDIGMSIGYFELHPSWSTESVKHLSMNLLRCGNQQVAFEAAEIFYGKNTFNFLGDHEWHYIVSWLDQIGHRNRSHLSKIEIEVRLPQQVWQQEDGSRINSCMLNKLIPVYPRNPVLLLSGPCRPGYVQNIHPLSNKCLLLWEILVKLSFFSPLAMILCLE
jgi:hypothetical protein